MYHTHSLKIYIELPKKTPSTPRNHRKAFQNLAQVYVTNKYTTSSLRNDGDEPTVMGIKLIKFLSNEINMYQWGYDPHRFCPMSVWAPM